MRKTTKERLCKVLWRDLRIVMRPESLERNFDTRGEGKYCIRWDGHGSLDNSHIRICSFDTMADCVKWGVVIQNRDHSSIEITANEPANAAIPVFATL